MLGRDIFLVVSNNFKPQAVLDFDNRGTSSFNQAINNLSIFHSSKWPNMSFSKYNEE